MRTSNDVRSAPSAASRRRDGADPHRRPGAGEGGGALAALAGGFALMGLILLLLSVTFRDSTPARWSSPPGAAQLVLLIVVDQLRADHLERYGEHFGEGGFNRLLERGASFSRAKYAYANTDTCPGHAVISTGTWPSHNGIVANAWYDRRRGTSVACAAAGDYALVGLGGPGLSPRSLLVPTIGDLLKQSTAGSARVVAVGGKDYATVMLGGHRPDAVYWTPRDTLFVTSTYYMASLPKWVRGFNASGRFTRHFGTRWERVLPAEAYAHLGPDAVAEENPGDGLGRDFPHPLDGGAARPGPSFVSALEASPVHNEVVADFALEALRRHGLGDDGPPDVLAISFSATDRIGHRFGPDSHETMDAVVRLDRLLERFFEAVEEEVGLDRTLIVLTADHGMASLPEVSASLPGRPSARRLLQPDLVGHVETVLRAAYGDPGTRTWVAWHEFPYLALDEDLLRAKGIPVAEAERVAAGGVMEVPGVRRAFSRAELSAAADSVPDGSIPPSVLLSFHPERSASVLYQVAPFVVAHNDTLGSNHGSGWDYDTHVPLLWAGPGVRAGSYDGAATPADIASTLAALLGAPESSAKQGRVLDEMLDEAAARHARARTGRRSGSRTRTDPRAR